MKRGICIAVSALLLAAPVQAQARVSGYEVREVPHTFTVKMGADGLTKDGEAVTLPEGVAIYQKDGAMMLPAEPFLKGPCSPIQFSVSPKSTVNGKVSLGKFIGISPLTK